MWIIIIILAILALYLAQEHTVAFLIIIGAIILFFIIRAIYRSSPAAERKAQEKEAQQRQAEEQTKQKIKDTIKESFNTDFEVSFHIGTVLAIDKINDRIYLAFSENTMNYHACLKPGAIFNYSLSPEYAYKSATNQAIKGTILAGTAGAVIGAASANNGEATGNYKLHIAYQDSNRKYHHTDTICSKEEGQEVIRYIEEAQKK